MNEEMSDSEMWAIHKEESQKKRWENFEKSMEILRSHRIQIEILDTGTGHIRVKGVWSFWPTTGKFYNPKTKAKGRGVFNLLKLL